MASRCVHASDNDLGSLGAVLDTYRPPGTALSSLSNPGSVVGFASFMEIGLASGLASHMDIGLTSGLASFMEIGLASGLAPYADIGYFFTYFYSGLDT